MRKQAYITLVTDLKYVIDQTIQTRPRDTTGETLHFLVTHLEGVVRTLPVVPEEQQRGVCHLNTLLFPSAAISHS